MSEPRRVFIVEYSIPQPRDLAVDVYVSPEAVVVTSADLEWQPPKSAAEPLRIASEHVWPLLLALQSVVGVVRTPPTQVPDSPL